MQTQVGQKKVRQRAKSYRILFYRFVSPIGRPVFEERGNALLTCFRKNVFRHPYRCQRVRFVEGGIHLSRKERLAGSDGSRGLGRDGPRHLSHTHVQFLYAPSHGAVDQSHVYGLGRGHHPARQQHLRRVLPSHRAPEGDAWSRAVQAQAATRGAEGGTTGRVG